MKRPIKHLRWFRDVYEPLGYHVEFARSGHLKVRDEDGRLVTTFSATPSDWRAGRKAQADMRRHHRNRMETP
jgi:hypothetical protein